MVGGVCLIFLFFIFKNLLLFKKSQPNQKKGEKITFAFSPFSLRLHCTSGIWGCVKMFCSLGTKSLKGMLGRLKTACRAWSSQPGFPRAGSWCRALVLCSSPGCASGQRESHQTSAIVAFEQRGQILPVPAMRSWLKTLCALLLLTWERHRCQDRASVFRSLPETTSLQQSNGEGTRLWCRKLIYRVLYNSELQCCHGWDAATNSWGSFLSFGAHCPNPKIPNPSNAQKNSLGENFEAPVLKKQWLLQVGKLSRCGGIFLSFFPE